jgi:pyruvate/2-oxoglutarate dehydrogenase complex dihydrolipoamide acyltransferase (E2) component
MRIIMRIIRMQNAPHPRRAPLAVPDCGVMGMPLRLSLWLVPEGSDVLEGDRVVELLAGGATIDLESPVTGRLVAHLADEDEVVAPGMVIAEFEATP